MSEINAKICQVPTDGDIGAFFEVRLKGLPRPGDFIDLFSFLDKSSGHPPRKHYEVVAVVHEMCDLTDDNLDGAHSVCVHVKPSQSKYFGN